MYTLPRMASLLSLQDLHVSVDGTEIVRGVSLEIAEGEVHAIMGPNGSGKSTLVSALMGHPKYAITGGKVLLRGKDLLAMEPHERSQAGLFLAFQYPKEISGVSLRSFLLAAHRSHAAADSALTRLSPLKFQKVLEAEMQKLGMDPAFAERALNKGFSGGEKKKAEVLQMAVLRPALALLDETDSGLDVDALRIVAEGVQVQRSERPGFSALVVTHYARILEHVKPDRVHVMVRGELRQSGGPELAHTLEKEGYAKYETAAPKARLGLDLA